MTTDQQQTRQATITTPEPREIHIERVFDAPRDRVFAGTQFGAADPGFYGALTRFGCRRFS